MFYINVVGQTMYATSTNGHLVEGSQEFVKFCFQLSDEWNGLTVFAQFRQGKEAYNKYLDSENMVKLPAEIKEGTCTLMLYGSHDTVIGTSNYLTFRVDKNMLVSNAGSTEISQSLYDQLVSSVADLDTRIDQIEAPGGSSKTITAMKITEGADGSVTMENTLSDGSTETIALAAGDNPESVTYNGVAIPITWVTESEATEGTEVSE